MIDLRDLVTLDSPLDTDSKFVYEDDELDVLPSTPLEMSESWVWSWKNPLQFHLKGKHNQKAHGHEGSSHVPDVSDTVKTPSGHVGEATEFMTWQKKDWLKVPTAPGKKKWFETDEVTVVTKGPGFNDDGKPLPHPDSHQGQGSQTAPAPVVAHPTPPSSPTPPVTEAPPAVAQGPHAEETSPHTAATVKALSEMPDLKAGSPQSKKWLASQADLYQSDPHFRLVTDAIALFTQGSFAGIQQASHENLTGKSSPAISWGNDNNRHYKMLVSPLANYKNYIPGQKLEDTPSDYSPGHGPSVKDAARALNQTINDSPPLTQSLFRGVRDNYVITPREDGLGFNHSNPPLPKVGDAFEVLGPSSFTTSHEIASAFSQGVAKGQGKPLQPPPFSTVIEISPGARGVRATALSPWDQHEVISSGRFKVLSATETISQAYGQKGGQYDIHTRHIVLQQIDTWKDGDS